MAIQTARRLPTTLVPTNISRPATMAILEPLTQIDIRSAVQDDTEVAGASRLTTRPAERRGFC
jgi:hypothetical protein